MFGKLIGLVKASVLAFLEDGALTYGAAIAYYTIFSIAPVFLIVIAIAGLGL
jgi:membrane protein